MSTKTFDSEYIQLIIIALLASFPGGFCLAVLVGALGTTLA